MRSRQSEPRATVMRAVEPTRTFGRRAFASRALVGRASASAGRGRAGATVRIARIRASARGAEARASAVASDSGSTALGHWFEGDSWWLAPASELRRQRGEEPAHELEQLRLGQLAVGPAHDGVGLDADLAQRRDRVLGRLGLQLAGRTDERDVAFC